MKSSVFGCKSFSHKHLPNCEVAWNTALTSEELKRKDSSLNFFNSGTNKSQFKKMSPLLRLNSEGEICTGKSLCDTSANVKMPLGQSNSFNSFPENLYCTLATLESPSKVHIPPFKKSASDPVPAKSQAHPQSLIHPVSGMSVKTSKFVCPMMEKFPLYSSDPRHLGSSDIFGSNQFGFDRENSSTLPSFQCSRSSSPYSSHMKKITQKGMCNHSNKDLHQFIHKCNKRESIAPDTVNTNLNAGKRSECPSCGNMNVTSDSNVNFVNNQPESSAKQQQRIETLPIPIPNSKKKRRRRRKHTKRRPSPTTATTSKSNSAAGNVITITDVREENCEPGKLDEVDICFLSDNEKCLVQILDTTGPHSSQAKSSKVYCASDNPYHLDHFSDDDLVFEESDSSKKSTKKKSKPESRKRNCPSSKIPSCATSDTESELESNDKDCSPISGLFFTLNVTVSEDDEDNDSCLDWDSTGSPCPSANDQFTFELEFNSGLSLDVILGKKGAVAETMSKELRDVNERWNKMYKDSSRIKPSMDPKVHFAGDDALATVHIVGNESRQGEWYLYALERTRFRDRIQDIGTVLAPVLCPSHRAKVWARMRE